MGKCLDSSESNSAFDESEDDDFVFLEDPSQTRKLTAVMNDHGVETSRSVDQPTAIELREDIKDDGDTLARITMTTCHLRP